jgi:hypothetical protein
LLAPTFEVEAKEPCGLSVEPARVNSRWIRARFAVLYPDFLPVTVNTGLRIGRKWRNLPAVLDVCGARWWLNAAVSRIRDGLVAAARAVGIVTAVLAPVAIKQ